MPNLRMTTCLEPGIYGAIIGHRPVWGNGGIILPKQSDDVQVLNSSAALRE